MDGYEERGGPNILGFVGAENLVPIPCKKIKRESKNASKKFGEYRVGFMLEAALACTGYKLQGRNEKCAKIIMKDFAHIPGLVNVCFSRVRGPKDNYIAPGEWPTALDINLQRLNPFVIEAQIFERAIQIKSMETIAKLSIDTGNEYGQKWSLEEYKMLLDMTLALKENFSSSITTMQRFIIEKLGKNCSTENLTAVMEKIGRTPGKILREPIPYLSEVEYKRLSDHKKKKKRRVV